MSGLRSTFVFRFLMPLGLLGATGLFAQVLDPPSLRCVSVVPAGDVTLTWVIPPDPNGIFSSYEIYHSIAAGGPYSLVNTILVYGTNTWFHAGVGADLAPQYYYMVTVSTSPPPNASLPGPVIASMFLSVDQSTPLGSAAVDWTVMSTPLQPTANPAQAISMEYPIGTWAQVGTVNDPLSYYEQVVSVCDDSLTFRIAVADAIGCVSFSNLSGGQFQDVTPPTTPVMSWLSVDTATNQTIVDWTASPEGDTDGYIVVLITTGGNILIDTLYGQNNTQYVWLSSAAGAGVESYTIAAFDTCLTGTPPSPNTSAAPVPSHSTMFASVAYDKCGGEITVNWTSYIGFPVQAYQVYAQFNGGAVYLLGTYPSSVLSAPHPNAQPFYEYCYVVKALEAGGTRTSLSNKICRTTDYPPVPLTNYLSVATVLGPELVQVVDQVDVSAQVRRYRLERSFNGAPWVQIASAPGGPAAVVIFNDEDVETDLRSYNYRILVDDSCGNEVLQSNTGNTIHLIAEADLDGFNRLRWNGYEDWAGTVGGYHVYRSVGGGPPTLLATTPAPDWDFEDDVRALIATTGSFCYTVEAFEAGNPSGVDAISVSNTACAVQSAEVWIPNAFIAGGYNNSFKPVIAYVDVVNYELTIFNRWGQSFWTTDDPDKAWDGMHNGAFVPQGVYAYYCAFQNGAGQRQEKRGTVTFIWGQE